VTVLAVPAAPTRRAGCPCPTMGRGAGRRGGDDVGLRKQERQEFLLYGWNRLASEWFKIAGGGPFVAKLEGTVKS